MSIIGSIRKRSGLIIVMIALGVAGFILMDVVQNNSIRGTDSTIGTVNGVPLDYNELQYIQDVLYQGSDADDFSKREYIWNQFVEQTLANDYAKELGLQISKPELLDLEFGKYKSPIIVQRFGNPQTGQANEDQLNQIKQMIKEKKMKPEMVAFWAIQEKEIIGDQLMTKMKNMVAKAMNIPTWQGEMMAADQGNQLNSIYVNVPFTAVADTEVKLTDQDYKDYYNKNKKKFQSDVEKREISYVTLPIIPSHDDTLRSQTAISEKIDGFKAATDDSTYVIANNGSISDAYVKLTTLSPVVQEHVKSLGVGNVYGPFNDAGKIQAVKLLGVKISPDSVESRHILIAVDQNAEGSLAAAEARIDSIERVIKSGQATFEAMAMKFSQDPGSKEKGGNLGYMPPGAFVKPFNDAIFYEMSKGQIKKVVSQFGVHLIQVLNTKGSGQGYKLAFIASEIVPSEETINKVQTEAEGILTNVKTIDELRKKLESYPTLRIDGPYDLQKESHMMPGLPSGSSVREIAKWVFADKTDVGEVAQQVFPMQDAKKYYPTQLLIVGLKGIKEANSNDALAYKDQMTMAITGEKKSAIIISKIKTPTTVQDVATQYSVKIDTAKNISYASNFIPGLGAEPKMIAAMFSVPVGSTSNPVAGNNGVIVVQPYEAVKASSTPSVAQVKSFFTGSMRQQAQNMLTDALKKGAKVVDRRGDLF